MDPELFASIMRDVDQIVNVSLVFRVDERDHHVGDRSIEYDETGYFYGFERCFGILRCSSYFWCCRNYKCVGEFRSLKYSNCCWLICLLKRKMLKRGIEPQTFALLARRSNQLSYSSTSTPLIVYFRKQDTRHSSAFYQ